MPKYFAHRGFRTSSSKARDLHEDRDELWPTALKAELVVFDQATSARAPYLLAAVQEWVSEKRPDSALMVCLPEPVRRFFVSSGLFRWASTEGDDVLSILDPLVWCVEPVEDDENGSVWTAVEDRLGTLQSLDQYHASAVPVVDMSQVSRNKRVVGVRLSALPETPKELRDILRDTVAAYTPFVLGVDTLPEFSPEGVTWVPLEEGGHRMYCVDARFCAAENEAPFRLYLPGFTRVENTMCLNEDLERYTREFARQDQAFWEIIDLRGGDAPD